MPLPTFLVSSNYLVTNAQLLGETIDKKDSQRRVNDATVANLTQTKQSHAQLSGETIDEEDNQRGVDDATIADLTQTKQFHKFNCATRIGEHLLCCDLNYSRHKPATRCCFMYPQHQRAHVTIYLQVPRDMSEEHNPDQQKIHIVAFNFPAHKVLGQIECSLVTTESFESLPQELINLDSLQEGFHPPQLGRSIEYHLIKFTAQDCIVSRGSLPKLLNADIQEQVQTALSFALSRDSMELIILVEGDSTLAFTETSNFNAAIRAERNGDPLMAFFELTPRARVLQLGNIIDFEARPNIPVQPAHLVFGDSMEYQVSHIMGATYEQEYRDFAVNDYEGPQFDSSWVELSAAKPDPDKPANAYLVYVKKAHFDLENLQHGDQVEVSLVGEFDEIAPQEDNGTDNTDNYLLGQIITTITKEEDELVGTLIRLKGSSPTAKNVPIICNTGGEGAKAIKFFKTAQNSNFRDNNSKSN